jgi:hypothetical protein
MGGQFVGQSQKLAISFDHERAGALIKPVFGRLLPDTSALVPGN